MEVIIHAEERQASYNAASMTVWEMILRALEKTAAKVKPPSRPWSRISMRKRRHP